MLPALIGAGASIIGGLINKSSADDSRRQQEAHSLRQEALQREFAQSGIQWRVEDAKKAGIHPIYALGSSGASYSPVSANFQADTSLGSALAQAGQDISGAMQKTQTAGGRIDAFTSAAQKLQLERGTLENEILKTELASKTARLNQSNGPPMPGSAYLIPGQTQSGVIQEQPMQRVTPGAIPHQEPGATTDAGHLRTSGGLFPVPSKDAKEKIEDNWYQETAHFIRNNMLPMISPAFNDPPHKPDPGKAWVYDPIYGYKQVPDRWLNRFFRN